MCLSLAWSGLCRLPKQSSSSLSASSSEARRPRNRNAGPVCSGRNPRNLKQNLGRFSRRAGMVRRERGRVGGCGSVFELSKVLQVNLVMSLLLYLMFLAYLLGFQARQSLRRPPSQDPVNALIIQLLQEGLSRERQRAVGAGPAEQEGVGFLDLGAGSLKYQPLDYPEAEREEESVAAEAERDRPDSAPFPPRPLREVGAELLMQSKRYSSPRVLLSERPPLEPPPLYLKDEFAGLASEGNRTKRTRRHTQHRSYRSEYSVCDSESQWVYNKTTAVDSRQRQVTVLGSFKDGRGMEVRQFFYETHCRNARPVRGGCRGIDDKHWNSQCKTAQTFVHALVVDRNAVRWRWIRINTSCACAISRKKRRT
ncbi:hypothetical protein GJAV_G00270590 [Gymnothorax javanicus]|nr:hypothetical protein GJAV_G00270590 [Gymnothorax javanicus]